MSATNPDQTPAPHPAPSTVSAGSDQPAWLRWWNLHGRPAKRMILWLGVAAVGTYAMGSAADRFLAGGVKDQAANGGSVTGSPTNAGGAVYVGWWNPAKGSIDASTTDSGIKMGAAATSSSTISYGRPGNGNSIIPVDRNAEFSSGSLTVNNPVSIGSNFSQTYAILGLGTRSFSAPSMTPDALSVSALHFSLSGDLNLLPVDNLATSGAGAVMIVAIPEPSTAGLLAAGFAGLALRRRRGSAKR